jgi:hypothetical protein
VQKKKRNEMGNGDYLCLLPELGTYSRATLRIPKEQFSLPGGHCAIMHEVPF